MTTTAIRDKANYYHNFCYEVGKGIDKDLAERFVKANFAFYIEEDKKKAVKKEVEKEAPAKKRTPKKKVTNEN